MNEDIPTPQNLPLVQADLDYDTIKSKGLSAKKKKKGKKRKMDSM